LLIFLGPVNAARLLELIHRRGKSLLVLLILLGKGNFVLFEVGLKHNDVDRKLLESNN
jgi:hypothetical protein